MSQNATIEDFNNGTYAVTATFAGNGSQYLSVYLPAPALTGEDPHMAHIAGSPFEIYVVAVPECNAEHLVAAVAPCGGDSAHAITFAWSAPGVCRGGMDLPPPQSEECDGVPHRSTLGAGLAAYAAMVMAGGTAAAAFAVRYQRTWVVRASHLGFCAALAGGCVALAAATVVNLGLPSEGKRGSLAGVYLQIASSSLS
jgi:hypothetical protein